MGLLQDIKDFFSGGSSSSGSNKTPKASTTTNSGDKITVSKPTGGRGSETVMSKPKNSAIDDFLMDIGAKPKNDVYYRDLADRQERSRAAMQQAMSSSDNDGPAPVPPRSPGPTPRPPVIDEPETVLPTEVHTPLTTVEDISVQTFTPAADFSPDVSVGQAEDEALELMKKGRRATILTKPSGLLGSGEEEGKTRRRRSLIG
jgi:hypothetical protein